MFRLFRGHRGNKIISTIPLLVSSMSGRPSHGNDKFILRQKPHELRRWFSLQMGHSQLPPSRTLDCDVGVGKRNVKAPNLYIIYIRPTQARVTGGSTPTVICRCWRRACFLGGGGAALSSPRTGDRDFALRSLFAVVTLVFSHIALTSDPIRNAVLLCI